MSDSELSAMRTLVKNFAQREVAPRVREYDMEERIPRDILEGMARLDLFGGMVPEAWGGAGMDHVTFSACIEEISLLKGWINREQLRALIDDLGKTSYADYLRAMLA